MASLYTHKERNIRKTWFLMTGFLIFVIAIGWLLSYAANSPGILYVAVLLSIVMNISAYWWSDKLVLKMTRAREAKESEYSELHNIVENLAITAGLPKPRIYIMHEAQPNAFATGRNAEHAVVAVTTGLLERLDRSELEGVLAHELSHIGNRDMLVSTVAVVLAGLIAILSDFFLRWTWHGGGRSDNNRGNAALLALAVVAALLAPIAATLIQLAVSRKREFLADSSGALLTRYPEGLASALEKISRDPHELRHASNATAHLFFENPFRGRHARGLTKLFMTHPPVEERVAALRGIELQ
jgi:heat shock protein HtpX